MKPENSSSGVYDGGVGKSIILTEDQYTKIQKLIEQALENSTIHTTDRVMMSARIIKQDGTVKKTCILKPGSSEITAIENELRKF
jgi:hypothetical protein